MLEGRLLNYFLVVAREQNMTKAAAELHISQPSLSTQMAELERQLGIKLFKRTNKNTLLTEDGILFRSRAMELIDLSNKIEAEFSSISSDISGDIFLGCAETHIMSHVSAVFGDIRREHPNVRLNIYSGDVEAVRERLDKGLLDMGLLLGPRFHDKYEYASLGMYDYFGLLVPGVCPLAERASVSFDELTRLPVLISAQTLADAHDMTNFDAGKIQVAGTYNLITNAVYMVEQGLGYALALADLVNTEGRDLIFVPLEPEVKIEAFIVTKKYAYLSKAAKLLLSRLKARTGS